MAERARVRRVAVLGGGISGLAAGFCLKELAAAHEMALEVVLFEANSRLGGALHTVRREGFTIEAGADSFLSEKPAALNLVERLGMTHELIQTQERFRKTYVVRKGRLVEIPAGFSLLAPALLRPVFTSPLFSLAGKLRIALEPLIPRRREDSDESLGAFVRRRLGDEALRRLAQPLAGGIYTADPEQLSVRATMPRFVEMERRHGSLIKGLRAAARSRQAGGEIRGMSGARWSLFLSFRTGMGALVERLAARLDDAIHIARISALEATDDGAGTPGWTVRLDHGAAYAADAIVCALPAHAAAPLLKPAYPALGAALSQIGYASAATVNLAWNLADFPRPPASFGFVVPIIEGRRIIAGSFSSLKFAQRAPEGIVLARVFIGGALQAGLM
ncbi:MAG: protoporphyrinogen oxidase, partial [Candidatus Binataceae bacterium]